MASLISVVVPCYNEEETIPLFYQEIIKVIEKLKALQADVQLLFVDDGSQDHTLDTLRKLSKKDKRVDYLSFSRNFGKEAALYAGLQHAKGDYAAVMDVDLQEPPELLIDMYTCILEHQEEYDCVAIYRKDRKGEPPIRSFFARQFYKLINKISTVHMVNGARDCRLMTRQMVDAILNLKEYNRFSKGLFMWVGFRIKWLPFENRERVAGKTKWSFWSLFKYSIEGIVGFSTAPLTLASLAGFIMFCISIIWAMVIVIKTLCWGDPTTGFPTLSCLVLFIGGLQLLCLGVIGKYLANTYLEVKRRPIYILKESTIDQTGTK